MLDIFLLGRQDACPPSACLPSIIVLDQYHLVANILPQNSQNTQKQMALSFSSHRLTLIFTEANTIVPILPEITQVFIEANTIAIILHWITPFSQKVLGGKMPTLPVSLPNNIMLL